MPPVDGTPGQLVDNLSGFGRALRRAGLAMDSARMALAAEALVLVGPERRDDVGAALEAVMVCREQDRLVFRELFDAYFRAPAATAATPGPALPGAGPQPEPVQPRQRVRDALAPRRDAPDTVMPRRRAEPSPDAAMTASALARLRQADFTGLGADEYQLLQRLVRDIRMPMPDFLARRVRPGSRGTRLHWPGVMRHAARSGGEFVQLPRMQRVRRPLPLLVLIDVSGSMERYSRMLLSFLHAATRHLRQRHVFAFGTQLTDLNPAMAIDDGDRMLEVAGMAVQDYAGGTQLGRSLAGLRRHHARCLVGRRTVVLLITDGLDTGAPQELARELNWLGRHCQRLLWLNPLLRFDGYAPLARGAQALHAHAHGTLAVHNLDKLEHLASSLAALMAR